MGGTHCDVAQLPLQVTCMHICYYLALKCITSLTRPVTRIQQPYSREVMSISHGVCDMQLTAAILRLASSEPSRQLSVPSVKARSELSCTHRRHPAQWPDLPSSLAFSSAFMCAYSCSINDDWMSTEGSHEHSTTFLRQM